MAGTPWYGSCSGDYAARICDAPAIDAVAATEATETTEATAGTPAYAAGTYTRDTVWTNPNWCQVPWCYVHHACPTFVPTSVFEQEDGAEAIGYSYQTCGGTDCYSADGWGKDADGVVSPANCPWEC